MGGSAFDPNTNRLIVNMSEIGGILQLYEIPVGFSYGGPVVTAGGLVFIAATPDRRLRAIDVRNGDELWQAELPAAGYSTPVTYTAAGRQFVVIAAGGGRQGPPSGSGVPAVRPA